jgi:myo-inositol 2-dehydrogenase/D-chiro-inositol 1-dehydrogenase
MDQIGVGFVGAGWMGSAQLRLLAARKDVRVLYLAEPNQERGRQVLAEANLHETKLIDDPALMMGDPRVNAVWLVSPNAHHGPQSLAALDARKHVFCEKPCATNYADYCRQIELDRAHPELITYVDYILYFDTMEQKLRQMVAAGDFGTITQIQVNYRHPVNISGDKAWKLKKDIMGDAISMGINHALSVMTWAMASQARPVSVFAIPQEAKVRGFEADPIWNILVRFDNGATGFCFGNIENGNGYDFYHNLYGTAGGFVFDSLLDRPQKVRYWSAAQAEGKWIYPLDAARCQSTGIAHLAWPAGATTPDSGDVIHHQLTACIDHFIDCIHRGVKSPLGFANSAPIAQIGWAAQASAILGQEVHLPLDAQSTGALALIPRTSGSRR